MWYTNVGKTIFRFVTVYAFDRRTDSFLMAIPCTALHAVARSKLKHVCGRF